LSKPNRRWFSARPQGGGLIKGDVHTEENSDQVAGKKGKAGGP